MIIFIDARNSTNPYARNIIDPADNPQTSSQPIVSTASSMKVQIGLLT